MVFKFFVQGNRPDTGVPMYIVGERHKDPVPEFDSLFISLRKMHPNLQVWIESTSYEQLVFMHRCNLMFRSPIQSPLDILAKYAYEHPENAKKWMYVDARRVPLYHLWEAFLDPESYKAFASHVQNRNLDMSHEQIKGFEKVFLKHMTSKRALRKWLGNMMFQNKVPEWYSSALNEWGGGDRSNPIYEVYSTLPKKHQSKIRAYFTAANEISLGSHVPWTVVADVIPKTRRTASQRLVFQKYKGLAEYFHSMYEVVMDIHAMCQWVKDDSCRPVLWVSGYIHAWNITRFMKIQLGYEWPVEIPLPHYIMYVEYDLLERRGQEKWTQVQREKYMRRAVQLLSSKKAIIGRL